MTKSAIWMSAYARVTFGSRCARIIFWAVQINCTFIAYSTVLACSHVQKRSYFLEGRLFFNQSELLESFLNCFD